MNSIAGTITGANTLKRADELSRGDTIPGGDAVNGHEVLAATTSMDAMLGLVIRVLVTERPRYREDATDYPVKSYTFRPYDKLWIEA